MDDAEIDELVRRLGRPHASGGTVIERAAILASGADFPAVMDWITARDGTPEMGTPTARNRGLHGSRLSDSSPGGTSALPQRFVLPAAALR